MSRGRLAAILGVAAVVAVAGVALGVVLTGPGAVRGTARTSSPKSVQLHPVLTALQVTTAANNYAFNYTTTFKPASDPGAGPAFGASTTSGHGVVDIDPYVMVTTNSADSSFPNVSAVFDSTRVWEFGAGDYGTGGMGAPSPGNTLSGFAQLVEGSLGQAQGALMMVDISSPSGRLNLDPSMMTGAQEAGTGTVDGVAVTNYRVTIDLWSELDQPTLSDEQRATITDALAILKQQGYAGTTEIVSVDALGFIRETKTVATFSNGGSVTNDSVLSDIGCAGTVTPGDPVPTPAPPGCVSPDQPGGQAARGDDDHDDRGVAHDDTVNGDAGRATTPTNSVTLKIGPPTTPTTTPPAIPTTTPTHDEPAGHDEHHGAACRGLIGGLTLSGTCGCGAAPARPRRGTGRPSRCRRRSARRWGAPRGWGTRRTRRRRDGPDPRVRADQ